MAPLAASPMISRPAVMRSNSASDSPSVRGAAPVRTSAPPRLISVPAVFVTKVAVLVPRLIDAGALILTLFETTVRSAAPVDVITLVPPNQTPNPSFPEPVPPWPSSVMSPFTDRTLPFTMKMPRLSSPEPFMLVIVPPTPVRPIFAVPVDCTKPP